MTKEELREDKVVTAVMEFGESVRKNAVAISIVGALILASLVVVQVVRSGRARAEQQAAVLLLDGETLYRSGGAAEAVARFLEAGERFGATRSGKVAILRAGDCLLEMDDLERARETYERFLETKPTNGLLRASGLRGLASVLDSMGEYEMAAERFVEVSEIEGNPLPVDDLLSAGRAWLDAGKPGEAEKTFTQILESFPGHPLVRDAREGLAEARALLGS